MSWLPGTTWGQPPMQAGRPTRVLPSLRNSDVLQGTRKGQGGEPPKLPKIGDGTTPTITTFSSEKKYFRWSRRNFTSSASWAQTKIDGSPPWWVPPWHNKQWKPAATWRSRRVWKSIQNKVCGLKDTLIVKFRLPLSSSVRACCYKRESINYSGIYSM